MADQGGAPANHEDLDSDGLYSFEDELDPSAHRDDNPIKVTDPKYDQPEGVYQGAMGDLIPTGVPAGVVTFDPSHVDSTAPQDLIEDNGEPDQEMQMEVDDDSNQVVESGEDMTGESAEWDMALGFVQPATTDSFTLDHDIEGPEAETPATGLEEVQANEDASHAPIVEEHSVEEINDEVSGQVEEACEEVQEAEVVESTVVEQDSALGESLLFPADSILQPEAEIVEQDPEEARDTGETEDHMGGEKEPEREDVGAPDVGIEVHSEVVTAEVHAGTEEEELPGETDTEQVEVPDEMAEVPEDPAVSASSVVAYMEEFETGKESVAAGTEALVEEGQNEEEEAVPEQPDDSVPTEVPVTETAEAQGAEEVTPMDTEDPADVVEQPEGPQRCDQCEFEAPTTEALTIHTLSEHDNEQGPRTIRCDQCGFKTKHETLLAIHKQNHSPVVKALKCPDCAFTTSHSASLQLHIRAIHKGVKVVTNTESADTEVADFERKGVKSLQGAMDSISKAAKPVTTKSVAAESAEADAEEVEITPKKKKVPTATLR